MTKGTAPPARGASTVQDSVLLRKAVILETPLSRLRLNPYAWLNREHIERWGNGFHLVTLAALSALIRRKGRTLGLSAAEVAESTGLHHDTTRAHLRSFEAAGLAVECEDGNWRPTGKLRKHGHAARLNITNLPVMVAAIGGAGFRLYCWDRLYTTRRGRLTVSFQRMAHDMKRSRVTVWRGYQALREAGIQCGQRFSRSVRKTVTSLRRKLKNAPPPTGTASGKRPGKGFRNRPAVQERPAARDREAMKRDLAAWCRTNGLAVPERLR